MATVERKQKRTLLTSMEDVIAKAKEHSLTPEFYKAAAASLKYISSTLELSKEEALLLSLFFEKSSSNRIWINNLADLVNTSTIRIISMMNVADDLVKKGYIKSSQNKFDENWYAVPKSVIDCIRQNTKIIPKPTTNLSFDDFFERLGEIMDEDASEDGMHICFTSGTSHLSKPVMISQQAVIDTATAFETALNGTPEDDTYMPLSASHIYAYTTSLALLIRGSKICFGRGIRYTEKDLAHYQPGLVVTVPGHMRNILESPKIQTYPKYFVVGGSLCTQENFDRATAAGITVQVAYGATETIGPTTISDGDGKSRGMRCISSKQMRLTEDKEILIAGALMDEYYRRREATNEVLKDGWYHTGDIGYLDEENRLFIEGRIRDIIVTENGEKINCNEVDDKLYGLPGSLEVAVFEVEGRMLAAVVPENETVTQEQLELEIGKYNATQPFSRRVVQVWRREEKFPRTVVGKLKRAVLTKEWKETFGTTE